MNPRTFLIISLLSLVSALVSCSSSPDYAVLPVDVAPKTQKGVVQDFYFPHSESGGSSAMNLVGRVLLTSGGNLSGLMPSEGEAAGPIYLIRLSNGRTMQYKGPGDLIMVRGDEVYVHTDRAGHQEVVPAKPRRMPFPR